jgi:uncharacterized phiE125 gp8 family phage protein
MPILYSKVTTEPTVEPVLLAEAKLHLKVDHNDDDLLIDILIQAARETVEQKINRSLITQSRTMKMDYFPRNYGRGYAEDWGAIMLPYGPISSVTTVKYYDEDEVQQTMSASLYWVDSSSGLPKIVVKDSWPSSYEMPNAVEVIYVAGYGASSSYVPKALRHAMYLIIGHLYENREQVGSIMYELPFGVHELIAPYVLEQSMIY